MKEAIQNAAIADVMALVLTYESPEAVAQCIRALAGQTVMPAYVQVIDNASETPVKIADTDAFASLHLERLESNLGPAGGHAEGLKAFLGSGCSYAWIMDDDCVPSPGTLQALVGAATKQGVDVVFPSVTDENGAVVGNPGWLGVLLSRSVVTRVGLPREELFWWAEDTEYLQWRIPRAGFRVERSTEAQLTVTRGRATRSKPTWKYYYESRNTVFFRVHVQWRSLGWRRVDRLHRAVRSVLKLAIRAVVVEDSGRSRCLWMVFRGVYDGLRRQLGVRVVAASADRPTGSVHGSGVAGSATQV